MKTARRETFMTSYPFTRIFCLLFFLGKLVQLVPLLNLHLCFGIFSPYSFSPSLQHHLLSLLYFVNLKNSHNVEIESVSSVVSDSLQPHEPWHTRPPCPSPTSRVYPNPCPLSWWCHPTISSCHPLLLLPSTFPSIRVFSNESALRIRWPKYWSFSFSISPSNEHPGLL